MTSGMARTIEVDEIRRPLALSDVSTSPHDPRGFVIDHGEHPPPLSGGVLFLQPGESVPEPTIVLVTGARGFIGSALVRGARRQERGDPRVDSSGRRLVACPPQLHPGARLGRMRRAARGDVATRARRRSVRVLPGPQHGLLGGGFSRHARSPRSPRVRRCGDARRGWSGSSTWEGSLPAGGVGALGEPALRWERSSALDPSPRWSCAPPDGHRRRQCFLANRARSRDAPCPAKWWLPAWLGSRTRPVAAGRPLSGRWWQAQHFPLTESAWSPTCLGPRR